MQNTLIREKNITYAALVKADRACRRRRHTTGTVPASWLVRYRELEAAYAEALAAVRVRPR